MLGVTNFMMSSIMVVVGIVLIVLLAVKAYKKSPPDQVMVVTRYG